jgi:hypothetical protein
VWSDAGCLALNAFGYSAAIGAVGRSGCFTSSANSASSRVSFSISRLAVRSSVSRRAFSRSRVRWNVFSMIARTS